MVAACQTKAGINLELDSRAQMAGNAREAFAHGGVGGADSGVSSKSAATLEAERLAAKAKAKREADTARIQAQFFWRPAKQHSTTCFTRSAMVSILIFLSI